MRRAVFRLASIGGAHARAAGAEHMRRVLAGLVDGTGGTCVSSRTWTCFPSWTRALLPTSCQEDGQETGHVRDARAHGAASRHLLAHLVPLSARILLPWQGTGACARAGAPEMAGSPAMCAREAKEPGEVRAHVCRLSATGGESWHKRGPGARVAGEKQGEVREGRNEPLPGARAALREAARSACGA
jgi:hypothetical protein